MPLSENLSTSLYVKDVKLSSDFKGLFRWNIEDSKRFLRFGETFAVFCYKEFKKYFKLNNVSKPFNLRNLQVH